MSTLSSTPLKRFVYTIKIPTVLRFQHVNLKLRGAYYANTEAEAWSALNQSGLNVLEIKGPDCKKRVPRPIRRQQDAEMLQSWLITSLKTGASLCESLKVIANSTDNVQLKISMLILASDIASGLPPANALERQLDVFPPFFRSAFQTSDPARHLALYSISEQSWQRRITEAFRLLLYPAILLLFLFVVVHAFGYVMVPSLTGLATQADLLKSFKYFKTFTTVMTALYPLYLLGLLAIIIYKTRAPLSFHEHLARLPGVSKILTYSRYSVLCRSLSAKIEQNDNLPKALRDAADTAGSAALQQRLRFASARIEFGEAPDVVLREQVHPLIAAFVRMKKDLSGGLELAAEVFEERSEAHALRLKKVIIPLAVVGVCLLASFFIIQFYGFLAKLPTAILLQM